MNILRPFLLLFPLAGFNFVSKHSNNKEKQNEAEADRNRQSSSSPPHTNNSSMQILSPASSVNKAFRQIPVVRKELMRFRDALSTLLQKTTDGNTEENQKNNLRDFLNLTFYGQYEVNEKAPIDLAVHNGADTYSPVAVIIEAKSTTNTHEMISTENLNRKAMQELVYYYLLERVERGNNELKHLIATNMQEFFIFDAVEFENFFFKNRLLVKQFKSFRQGGTTDSSTRHFYEAIAAPCIEEAQDKMRFTHFDLRHYRRFLDDGRAEKLVPLYRIFSDIHLLKLPFQNDSNTLDSAFYSELLHIMGLEEVKEGNKQVIRRKEPQKREEASLIENTIDKIEDRIYKLGEKEPYGETPEEITFNVALELCITWVNRILFLKLLESQLLKYHEGNTAYRFLTKEKIADFDELNALFFKVLAKNHNERKASVLERFPHVPYLNSSLFESTRLEDLFSGIGALSQTPVLSVPAGSVLRKSGYLKGRTASLHLLDYLFAFLDAYNFAGEGTGEVMEESKTLISASVLGLIFEKINGHRDGAVFTPGYVTMYMSRETICRTVIRRFNEEFAWQCASMDELYNRIDRLNDDVRANQVVNSIRILDPAVGSGHFLVSALNEIIRIKSDLGILQDESGRRLGRAYNVDIENDELIISDADTGQPFAYRPGSRESQRVQRLLFREKKTIIENCLFGVDLNPNSVNICRLRLWIELLKNAYYTEESGMKHLETLPNIDINIKCGNSLLHRIPLERDLRSALRDAGISISDYRQAVSQYKTEDNKAEKFRLNTLIENIKKGIKTQFSQRDPHLLEKIRKTDELALLRSGDLFELSAREKTQRERKIRQLEKDIEKIDAHFEEQRSNRFFINAFEWRFEFPELLDDEGRFLGFDCIIGNPPYIQLQTDGGKLAALYADRQYDTFERKGDIYCLFYEQGLRLLKPGGLLCFITSNKWMRADYGKSLRRFLSTRTRPLLLLDFAGFRVFENVTVDVNILLLARESGTDAPLACTVNSLPKADYPTLTAFAQQNAAPCPFPEEDSWVILSPIEQSIKRKIEAVGTPLKDWDININYGIKTGYNDAFIITTEKRNEILANCRDEAERARTEELIRPILRGRDIKRYGYEWANLYLIATFPSRHYNIEDFPAVKDYLLSFGIERLEQTGKTYTINGEKIKARKKTNNKWFETQDSISYHGDFLQQKIVWGNLNLGASFALVEDSSFINAPSSMIVPASLYLLGVLNSSLADYYIRKLGVSRNGGYFEYKPMFVEQLPIPIDNEMKSNIENAVMIQNEQQIDSYVYSMYKLTEEEIIYIESRKF